MRTTLLALLLSTLGQLAAAACSDDTLRDVGLAVANADAVRFKTDITRRARAHLHDGAPFDIKVRRTARGLSSFNNEPRYELAAYELQRLLFDSAAEVVPPTVLRSMPLADFRALDPAGEDAFGNTGAALFVTQCWLAGAKAHPLAIDLQRFASDLPYARAISNLNVFTYLIAHKDSNLGNVMLTEGDGAVRAWAIDNGVAFDSEESDRGDYWKVLRVPAIDRRLHARLAALDRATLDARLLVVAEFVLADGNWQSRAPTSPISTVKGVRRREEVLQLGLTRREIIGVERRIASVLDRVTQGRLALLPES